MGHNGLRLPQFGWEVTGTLAIELNINFIGERRPVIRWRLVSGAYQNGGGNARTIEMG